MPSKPPPTIMILRALEVSAQRYSASLRVRKVHTLVWSKPPILGTCTRAAIAHRINEKLSDSSGNGSWISFGAIWPANKNNDGTRLFGRTGAFRNKVILPPTRLAAFLWTKRTPTDPRPITIVWMSWVKECSLFCMFGYVAFIHINNKKGADKPSASCCM